MIVIELEEKQYGKSMEAVSMIKKYAECLEEMFTENSMGRGSIGYRGGSGMSQRGGMGYKGIEEDPYHKYPKEYPMYDEMLHRGYREDYGKRYM